MMSPVIYLLLLIISMLVSDVSSLCETKRSGFACREDGDFMVQFREIDGGANVEFFISSKSVPSDGYVAVGFNTASLMAGSSIVQCVRRQDGTNRIEQSSASSYIQPTIYTYSQGISSSSMTYTSGTLECYFIRPKARPSGAPTEFKSIALTQADCLVMAMGPASGLSSISQHSARTTNIGCDIDYSSTAAAPPTTPPPTTAPSANCILPGFGCISAKGMEVHYKDLGADVEFFIRASPPGNGWVGLGFNTDTEMTGSSIVECIEYGGSFAFRSSYAASESYPGTITGALDKITSTSANRTNGQLLCHFIRAKAIPQGTDANFRDISTSNCLVMAMGPSINAASIGKHSTTAGLQCAVDYAAVGSVQVTETLEPAVAIHGICMIIGWLILISNGILVARYFKKQWKADACGKDQWFRFHQVGQTLGLLLVVIAFIAIFVEEGEFVDDKTAIIHAVFGIIATGLGIIQPVMAALRCAPNDSNRYIFNWAHFIAGNIAHWCAVAAIILVGTFHDDVPGVFANPNRWFGITIAYCVFFILIKLILEVMKRKEEAAGNKVTSNGAASPNQMETSEGESEKERIREQMNAKRKVVIIIYYIGNLVITIALIVSIF